MGRRKTKLSQLYAIAYKTQTSILACPLGGKSFLVGTSGVGAKLPNRYVRSTVGSKPDVKHEPALAPVSGNEIQIGGLRLHCFDFLSSFDALPIGLNRRCICVRRLVRDEQSWSRLSEQCFRVDRWSLCRG